MNNKYSSIDIANYIIWLVNKDADKPLGSLTPLKLQKILYYVYTTYLKKYDESLFPEPFQKWQYGPVVKEVYHEFKTIGVNHISSPKLSLHEKAVAIFGGLKQEYDPSMVENDLRVVNVITDVVTKLIPRRAFDLVELTHRESAWKDFTADIMSGKRELTYSNEELYLAEII